jgi:hypothetical protein
MQEDVRVRINQARQHELPPQVDISIPHRLREGSRLVIALKDSDDEAAGGVDRDGDVRTGSSQLWVEQPRRVQGELGHGMVCMAWCGVLVRTGNTV